jgi:hypothetical protein
MRCCVASTSPLSILCSCFILRCIGIRGRLHCSFFSSFGAACSGQDATATSTQPFFFFFVCRLEPANGSTITATSFSTQCQAKVRVQEAQVQWHFYLSFSYVIFLTHSSYVPTLSLSLVMQRHHTRPLVQAFSLWHITSFQTVLLSGQAVPHEGV